MKPYHYLGDRGEYRYDKQFHGNRGARRAQQRYRATVSRLARRRSARAWQHDVRRHAC